MCSEGVPSTRTFAPRFASSKAICSPIPREAPVTIATLPARGRCVVEDIVVEEGDGFYVQWTTRSTATPALYAEPFEGRRKPDPLWAHIISAGGGELIGVLIHGCRVRRRRQRNILSLPRVGCSQRRSESEVDLNAAHRPGSEWVWVLGFDSIRHRLKMHALSRSTQVCRIH